MYEHFRRSRDDWNHVPMWKNREAYIAVCRLKAGMGSYHQWDNFLLSDFLHRQVCAATFIARHLKLRYSADSSAFKGRVKDPPAWNDTETRRRGRKTTGKSKSTGRGTATVKPVLDAKLSDSDSDSDVILMMFDPAKGELVPVHDLE